MAPTLYLMLGFPGAGKTTTSKIIHELTGAVHLWADHERREMYGTPTYSHEENLHLYSRLNDETEHLLKDGKSVIYDTNFNYQKDRDLMRAIAERAKAQTVLIWIHVPETLALERATDSSNQESTRVLGNMPPATFQHIVGQLEKPDGNERAVVLDGTKITKEYVAEQLGL
jgi:predicted kinase